MIKQLLLFCLCCTSISIWAQTPQELLLQSKIDNFNTQVQLLPQEKLYVHTDKDYYITGEQIFFRAHLLDATYHIPVHVSRYVYVELINPLDVVIARLKIRPISNAYYGQINLPIELPEGNYQMRAYTHFMRNLDEAYFFTKNIYIADPNSAKMQLETQFNIEKETDVFFDLHIKDLNTEPFPIPNAVNISVNDGKEKEVKQNNGSYSLKFSLPTSSEKRILLLQTTYRGYPYRKFIAIPKQQDTYEINFFPEGGQLLQGAMGAVAFKALNKNGAPEHLEGIVVDELGNKLTDFATVHLGMGIFYFTPQKDKKYYAECTNLQGVKMRIELPQAYENAMALGIKQTRTQIYVTVNKSNPIADSICYLMLQTRGRLVYADMWHAQDASVVFEKNELGSGVYHFILLNQYFKPISERLVFVENADQIYVTELTTQTTYATREKVILKWKMTDLNEPIIGNFSVSVTDNNEVQLDSTTNILTHLLLTSDLRGTILTPASYFDKKDKKASFKLDILMLTQGWKRYNIANALQGTFAKPMYDIERNSRISGKVQGGFPLKNQEHAQVTLISKDEKYSDITETNADGVFVFDKIEFPDTTQFLLQALSKKGSYRMVLTLDNETFPPVSPWHYPQSLLPPELLHKYVRKEEQKYIAEHGIRLINLDEIDVIAQKKQETRSVYTAYADQSLTAEDIGTAAGLTVKKLLQRIGTVTVDGDGTVSIRRQSPVLLLVNDVETDLVYLDDIDANEVLRIDVIQSTLAFGQKSANGVISISTKSLQGISDKPRFNVKNITPLGCHVPAEFYAMKYDTQQAKQSTISDLRTTIHWQPVVVLNNSGEAEINFYTADNASQYTVLVQGVSITGKIIYHKGAITVN